jgi:hypothetical protein
LSVASALHVSGLKVRARARAASGAHAHTLVMPESVSRRPKLW